MNVYARRRGVASRAPMKPFWAACWSPHELAPAREILTLIERNKILNTYASVHLDLSTLLGNTHQPAPDILSTVQNEPFHCCFDHALPYFVIVYPIIL